MRSRAQHGFSMIEILVTLSVVIFGVIGHVTFQRLTFHEVGLSTSRARASELALEKLEDLRSFGCLKTAVCTFAFQDIATNAGGNLNGSNTLLLPSATTFVVGNTTYTRSWTIINYWYAATNSAPATTAPAGSPTPLPSFKVATVNITWTDTNGGAQTLGLSTLIAGIEPADAARAYQ